MVFKMRVSFLISLLILLLTNCYTKQQAIKKFGAVVVERKDSIVIKDSTVVRH